MNSRFGVKVVRVDAGGTLIGQLLRQGLVNEVSLLIYPSLVGGETQSSIFRAPDLPAIAATAASGLPAQRRNPPQAPAYGEAQGRCNLAAL